MSATKLVLLIGLVTVCFSQKKNILSKDQIQFFKNNVVDWGAPAIHKYLNGSIDKVGEGTTIMEVAYTTQDGQSCTADHTLYEQEEHSWLCNGPGGNSREDSDTKRPPEAKKNKISKAEIAYIKKIAEKWGAPGISKVTGGTSEVKGGNKVIQMDFESDKGKRCSISYMKFPSGKEKLKWCCEGEEGLDETKGAPDDTTIKSSGSDISDTTEKTRRTTTKPKIKTKKPKTRKTKKPKTSRTKKPKTKKPVTSHPKDHKLREINKEEIDFIKRHAKEWGVPPVFKPLNGTSEVKDGETNYVLGYECKDRKVCTVHYMKEKDGTERTKWCCREKGSKPDDDGNHVNRVDLSPAEIKFFGSNLKKWGAPGIAEYISGSAESKGGETILKIKYKSDNGKICTAEYRKTKSGKLEKSYCCKEDPNSKGTTRKPNRFFDSDSVSY